MASNDKSENTYIIDTESAAEMARLIDQSRCMNEAMGDLIRDSRYFGFLLRSKNATRRTKSEREKVSIEQTR